MNYRCETVYQKKVLDYIESNFEMECIQLEFIDKYTIKVIDKNGDSIKFGYSWNKVIVRD